MTGWVGVLWLVLAAAVLGLIVYARPDPWPDRIVAEGPATSQVIVYERFFIEANGRRIEMMVVEVTPGGTWAAQDVASLKAQRLISR
jgi:hypothetical protein